MQKILLALLLPILVLCACSPGQFSPATSTSFPAAIASSGATELPTRVVLPVVTQEVLPSPKWIATVSTPHIEQGPEGASTMPSYPEGCGYQWAYQAMPELSAQFLAALQQLQPEAQGDAFGFGENCLGSDGQIIRFIAMETDFNITLPVNDHTNNAELGEWVVQIMQVIDTIPPEQIMGPRPGRVRVGFQSNGQQTMLSFYIDEYHGLPRGLSAAEIYRALQTQ